MFKVGDRVKIKESLDIGSTYEGVCFADEMKEYCGKILTISEVYKTKNGIRYWMKEDYEEWCWSEEMFESISGENEMTTLEYFRQKERMVKSECTMCGVRCHNCPLYYRNNGRKQDCSVLEMLYPEEAIAAVKKWADEHPGKTRLQDFLEKYPNAPRSKDGLPEVCAKHLGYCKECYRGERYQDCEKCWNTFIE